jgi:hypothetical protein
MISILRIDFKANPTCCRSSAARAPGSAGVEWGNGRGGMRSPGRSSRFWPFVPIDPLPSRPAVVHACTTGEAAFRRGEKRTSPAAPRPEAGSFTVSFRALRGATTKRRARTHEHENGTDGRR